MQLAAIDKDFLKFRSDMEAKVSDQMHLVLYSNYEPVLNL